MPSAVDPDIQRLNDDYCAAYNAGDIRKLLAFLADDVITLSPDQGPVRGHEAHRKYFEAALGRESVRKLALRSIRSQRSGEILYDSGEWTNTIGISAGAQTISGFYLTVYRQEQGAWKASVLTFNFRT